MGKHIKCITTITFIVLMIGLSDGFAITSRLDPVDRCIYTCVYCFKDNIGVICANECLATEGKMYRDWFISCPQLSPRLFWKAYDIEDDNNLGEQSLDNILQ